MPVGRHVRTGAYPASHGLPGNLMAKEWELLSHTARLPLSSNTRMSRVVYLGLARLEKWVRDGQAEGRSRPKAAPVPT